jgi:hypothetical protein
MTALRSGKWCAKGTCGHWSDPGPKRFTLMFVEVGVMPCVECGSPVETTGEFRAGGLTASQTARKLAAKEEAAAKAVRYVTAAGPGGGMIQGPPGEERGAWWCRRCHGKKADKWHKARFHSLEDLTAKWADHTASDRHRRNVSTTGQGMSVAAERLNRDRQLVALRRAKAASTEHTP